MVVDWTVEFGKSWLACGRERTGPAGEVRSVWGWLACGRERTGPAGEVRSVWGWFRWQAFSGSARVVPKSRRRLGAPRHRLDGKKYAF